LLLGHLDVAQQAASLEKTKLLTRDSVWSYKFCLLEAETFALQGKSKSVVDVIERQDHTFTLHGDLAIKQQLLLSQADARLGNSQRSAAELQTAQQMSQATHSLLQGEVLRTQGLLENRDGQQAAAEMSIRKSLEFARLQNDEYLEASDLLNLGTFAVQEGHLDEGLDDFKASTRLAIKAHADRLLQINAGNSAWVYYELGDFENAIQGFRESKKQARAQGATDTEIIWLQGEGLSLSRLGELEQAQACYQDALHDAQASKNIAQQARIETALALLYLRLNLLREAKSQAAAALALSQHIGNKPDALIAALATALIASRTPNDLKAEHLLLQVLHDGMDVPSVRWQSQDALATLYATQHRPAQAEQWYRKSIQTFETQRSSVQDTERRLPFLANGDELYRHYADFLIATQRSTEALYLLDGARAKTLKEGLGQASLADQRSAYRPVADVRRDPSIVLFYSLGADRSYLWAIDGRSIRLFTLPPMAEIKNHIESYQASILKSRDPLQDANPDAIWLYHALVAPAEPLMRNRANIVVIPDGPLHGFNMETLLKKDTRGLHYWIDDVTLTTASSLQLLAHSESTPQRNQQAVMSGRLLLIGDPLPSVSEYQLLPHAHTEIDDVVHYFPDGQHTTLTQGAAIPAVYATVHPEQYDYLHFVAHGVASTFRPLDSAIVLSPTPSDADHFKLYARDIVHQPLHARLVTISACYGSGVRNYAGEGLVGLAWAFLRAGAHQVIGALWEVNDSSTPQLMDQMYRELAHGARPEQALRTAKLSLLHSQGVFRKPLYWAAFQIYSGS
jgi:CHAT domain-containing protein